MSEVARYMLAAEDLRANPGQWSAYNSTGHCAVLAGPGSGKTKVLTIKLARMLAEDVRPPRGIACITYNNECAKELEHRLAGLGVESRGRVFIGTVHSFALTQILLPYAKTAKINLPDPFRVATHAQQEAAFNRAFQNVVGGAGNPAGFRLEMGRYRRSILDRSSERWQKSDPQTARLVEAYEMELRRRGLIDFDDMPLLALDALTRHEWLRRAIRAKYPILVVDEYQDLGQALHAMVMGLCFRTGIRLFAVGDVDQSIYGFTGAHPELLLRVARRDDVETIRLRLNYRCSVRIVAAAEYALGQERGYVAVDGAEEGDVVFHPQTGPYEGHAQYLVEEIIPDALDRLRGLTLGQIAILYPAAWIGDAVANEALRAGLETIRTDGKALYPRNSALLRWLESCAVWGCNGWRTGTPGFGKILAQGARIFAEGLTTDASGRAYRRSLLATLWEMRDPAVSLHAWLTKLRDNVLHDLAGRCRTVDDEWAILSTFIDRIADSGDASAMTLGDFAGFYDGQDRMTLSTLHSAKGREFGLVVLFGMDEGRLPHKGASDRQITEARRLFYVGFTRAKREVHILYSENAASRFVSQLLARLEREE